MTRLLVAAALALLPGSLRAADVTLVSGAKRAGELVALDASGLTLEVAGVAKSLPLTEVAAVEMRPPPGPASDAYDEVELVDGSLFQAKGVKIRGKRVELAFRDGGPILELPLDSVASVLRGAENAANRAAWQKLLGGRGKRDLFVVRQADGLNPLPGTVLGGTEAGDAVNFERDDGTRAALRLARATGGLLFNPKASAVVPPTVGRVRDRAGNVLVARSVRLDAGKLIVATVSGASATYATLGDVAQLDFRQGNVAYLSELTATLDRPAPEADGPLGGQYPFALPLGRDRSSTGAPLSVGGKLFARGLALPADAAAVYPLSVGGGNWRELRFVLALPAAPDRPERSARLHIELDGAALFDEVVKSSDAPRELAVVVRGGRELRLSAERTGLFRGEQVYLLEARLQK